VATSFDVIVFDLGGVLVELAGVQRMIELMGGATSVEELWRRWLSSESVRAFESGRIASEEFAVAAVTEFGLSIDAASWLKEFSRWPRTLYPGAIELLEALSATTAIACLSNTNELHWTHMMDTLGLDGRFTHQFASHLIGMLKPDREVFDHVIMQIGSPPERILFLDDNEINVLGARSVGIAAERVHGVEGARRALEIHLPEIQG
jgi:putative hydrolase of the HAD superfamily